MAILQGKVAGPGSDIRIVPWHSRQGYDDYTMVYAGISVAELPTMKYIGVYYRIQSTYMLHAHMLHAQPWDSDTREDYNWMMRFYVPAPRLGVYAY